MTDSPGPGKPTNNQGNLPTPVNPIALEAILAGYDETFKRELVNGFKYGFKVGFQGPLAPTKSKNLTSSDQNPKLVDEKLNKELSQGRILGPYINPPFEEFRTSPIGLVPKKEPGKYRLIHHLSHPEGTSINDGIPEEKRHVAYQNIDHAVSHLKALGKDCWMAKTDIADAFRIIPLHPSQYHLFGICWRDQFYFDKCLPMGCSASCQLFESLSTALHWIANNKLNIHHMSHILDDFLLLDHTEQACKVGLNKFVDTCKQIGVPIAPEKTFQPSQVLTFLGYELDSTLMEIRLPVDKLEKCEQLITESLQKTSLQLKQLQSIIGTLNFACGAVVPGRPFLRRLINLTVGVKKPHHFIRINKEARKDLEAWLRFLKDHNGRSAFLPDRWLTSQSLNLFSDASGAIGYGAMLEKRWFQGQWNTQWKGKSISVLEFYPIVLAVEIWAKHLQNKCIKFNTDNAALVDVVNKQTAHDTKLMALLRRLVLTCLCNNILFQAQHLPGKTNKLADLLSRGHVQEFLRLAPQMHRHPTSIPDLPEFPS